MKAQPCCTANAETKRQTLYELSGRSSARVQGISPSPTDRETACCTHRMVSVLVLPQIFLLSVTCFFHAILIALGAARIWVGSVQIVLPPVVGLIHSAALELEQRSWSNKFVFKKHLNCRKALTLHQKTMKTTPLCECGWSCSVCSHAKLTSPCTVSHDLVTPS